MQLPAEIPQLIIIAITLFFASAWQSVIGFGIALFAIPIFLWVGLTLPQAVTLTIVSAIVQSTLATYHLRQYVPWTTVAVTTIWKIFGIFVGLAIMIIVAGMDITFAKQFVGGTLLAIVLAQWLLKIQPRDQVHWAWGMIAFFISGIMSGSVGMGGPAMVLWVMAHKWSATKTRGFLLASTCILTPLQLALLYWKFNSAILSTILFASLCIPLIIVGSYLGLWLGKHISKTLLRQTAYGFLVIIAIVSILSPLLD